MLESTATNVVLGVDLGFAQRSSTQPLTCLIEECLQEVQQELLLRVRCEDVVRGNGGAEKNLCDLKMTKCNHSNHLLT